MTACPDASVAINIGGSFTYYYLAPDAGTYFWHCHITPPEHLQMGMVGQIYVRPRQNRVPVGDSLYTRCCRSNRADPRTACDSAARHSLHQPAARRCEHAGDTQRASGKYAYNDGDGSTCYDVEYPLQIHGFDPNFHFVGMTFNPEGFTDMKDKYFLLNGRSYPDTVTPGPDWPRMYGRRRHALLAASASDHQHSGWRQGAAADLRPGCDRVPDAGFAGHSDEGDRHQRQTAARQAGNNLYYNTNSITLGGGESLDVILDASDTCKVPAGSVFYLYTPNLDHLSNDAENFGGLMTEVQRSNLRSRSHESDEHEESRCRKTRLLLATVMAVALFFTATAHAAAPGITGPTFDLAARLLHTSRQPDGSMVYSWGYGCNGAPTGFAPAAIQTAFCSTMQVPGPTLIVTEGQTVTVNLHEQPSRRSGQHVDSVPWIST